ncbi:MAG: hypothetical protein EAZ57_06020 [Cytophagales bacterium]|nr:MAG: hypothetical protein EAZ67_08210 [Cytophagales bacterium]TAF60739.1 MAG: hypothetical protein EAZ57_06020 [Cytophagales bacterium]
MSKLSTFLFLLLFSYSLTANCQLHTRLAYQMSVPLGQMGKNMADRSNGIAAELGLHLRHTPITLGWQWNYANYGYSRMQGLNVFAVGAQSMVETRIINSFYQSHFFIQYDMRSKGLLKPYWRAGLGSTHFITGVYLSAEGSTAECPKPIIQDYHWRDRACMLL